LEAERLHFLHTITLHSLHPLYSVVNRQGMFGLQTTATTTTVRISFDKWMSFFNMRSKSNHWDVGDAEVKL
jgi:hypothetical protein